MITSQKLIQRVNDFYTRKRTEKLAKESFINSVLTSYPEYLEVENAIGKTKLEIAKSEYSNDYKTAKKLSAELKILNEKKSKILDNIGYYKFFSKNENDCELCKDTGFVNGKRCKCFTKKLTAYALEELGIRERPEIRFGASRPDFLKKQYDALEAYCKAFPDSLIKNFVFTGNSGTGKTYLASCVVSEISSKGYNAIFLTANELNDIFLKLHTGEADRILINDILTTADLLVIDDLGTEPIYNNITAEYLLSLISRRSDKDKPFIITTNLSPSEILARYNERFYSRISGKKTLRLLFEGYDLRKQ